jgi:exo-poly-alpha-galacturonosidase
LEGLTFTNPAHHGIVNYQCEGVTSIGVKVMTFNCNNGDGIEFGDCRDLYILNNFYDTGDDAINFAAGQGASVRNTSGKAASGGGKAVNNYVRNGHGGLIAAGSHTAGWIGDLLVEDNIFKGSETGGAGVIRLKSGGTTGGGVRNITFRDSAIHHQRSSAPVVQIDRNYSDSNASTAYAPESEVPVVYEDIFMRNITISGVSTKELVGCTNPVWAKQGYKMVARKFHVEDIAILSTGDGGNKIRVQDVSDSSFKNIRYAGNVDGYVSLTDCRNITVQNITGTSGVQPDIIPASLDWRSGDSLAVSVEGNKVTLRWNPIPGADGGYKILAKEDSPLSRYFTERASVDPGVTAWTGYFSPNTRYALGVLAQSAEANGNTAVSGTALTASVATGANTAPPGVPIPPQTLTIGNAAHSGVSWMNLNWTNAAPGDNGIQYYKIRAAETATGRETEYRCYYPAYWSFDAPLGHPNRSGYGLADLKDGTEYTATVSAVDWAGGESTAYQPLTFTTVPGTLMEIPRWKSSSVLAGELSQDGGTLRLSWNAVDVTDRAGGDGVSRFAGYRITVNGVPVPAVSPTGEVLNQVNAVSNTQDTVFDLDVRAYKPGTYTVSVEAGDEILKIASGTGGLAGAASFLGTKNTEKLRNTITFGKWTGHGPKITVTLKD